MCSLLAIVDGEKTVTHFTSHLDGSCDGNGLVQQIPLIDFIKDYPFGVYKYGVRDDVDNLQWPGTYCAQECESTEKVLKRVSECLRNGFGEYQILGNNCEDFAYYCKTGQRQQSNAQFQATMTRVAATRSALEAGHKSPVVLAGCLLGMFNANDFAKTMDEQTNEKKDDRE